MRGVCEEKMLACSEEQNTIDYYLSHVLSVHVLFISHELLFLNCKCKYDGGENLPVHTVVYSGSGFLYPNSEKCKCTEYDGGDLSSILYIICSVDPTRPTLGNVPT